MSKNVICIKHSRSCGFVMQDYDPRTVKVPPEVLGKMSGMLLIIPSDVCMCWRIKKCWHKCICHVPDELHTSHLGEACVMCRVAETVLAGQEQIQGHHYLLQGRQVL